MQKSIITVSASEIVMSEEEVWVSGLRLRAFLAMAPCSPGCCLPGDCNSRNSKFPNEQNANCSVGSPPHSGQRLLVAFHAPVAPVWELQAALHDFVTDIHGIIHPRALFPGSLSQTTFPYKHLAFICCPPVSSPLCYYCLEGCNAAQPHTRHGVVMYHSDTRYSLETRHSSAATSGSSCSGTSYSRAKRNKISFYLKPGGSSALEKSSI